MVKAEVKKLGFVYKARVQLDMFEDLYTRKLDGSGEKTLRAMDHSFLESPKSIQEKRIRDLVLKFQDSEIKKSKTELNTQQLRLSHAEKALMAKTTKKALNDQRIATNKIEQLTQKIERLESNELTENDSRIYPGLYCPLIVHEQNERVLRPFRYQLRPKDQDLTFDRRFDGTYNARRDRLTEVFWWKQVFGRNHGILVIEAFYENVKRHDFENRALRKGETEENLILKFHPRSLREMTVPCIFDSNNAQDYTLHSFALITDEPNPEVAAAGHDRTPIIMKADYLDNWLIQEKDLSKYEQIFNDKQPTYFEHEVAA